LRIIASVSSLKAIQLFCALALVFSLTFCIRNVNAQPDRETFIRWDKKGLLYKTGVVTDRSKEMLKIPDMYKDDNSFVMAKTPPKVDFAPVRNLEPYFFPKDNPGLWSLWGIGTIGPDGCFYFAVGSHQNRDGNIFIIKYDPKTKEQRVVVDCAQILGWRAGDYIDGKIHGELAICPDGLLPAATFFSSPPEDMADIRQYRGGKLFTYNIFTGKFNNLGVPFTGDSWAYHATDIRRGIFIGCGHFYNFLAYDIRSEKTLYAGKPPDGMQWESCNALLDNDTGLWYATEGSTKHTTHDFHFMEYDPVLNRFRKLSCMIPTHPVTGERNMMRACTQCRMPDGAFYCMCFQGAFFKFRPEQEKTELIGLNWSNEGTYVTCIAANEGSRYLYYVISGHGRGYEWGAPVIQYDTKTQTKKALAFLHPYYHEKYGFVNGGSYCFAISPDGSTLYIVFNGAFCESGKGDTFGNPCLTVVHIPESEREE